MRSLVEKSLYASLGLLGTGAKAMQGIGREISRKASISEKEGEKIARKLRVRSERAIDVIQKKLAIDVNRATNALHEAIQKDLDALRGSEAPRGRATKRKQSRPRAKRSARR